MTKQYIVIDNGSYNIKAGFNSGESTSTPLKISNSITKTRDGLIHIGNQYQSHTNNYSGIQFKRPHDQGHLTSWETEKPIWDYTLDQLSPDKEIDPGNVHLTLTEPAFQLPQLSINTDQIVFEEYGFSQYYRCMPASLVPFAVDPNSVNTDFSLVIDAGFSSTWIVPMIYQNVYWEGVRKLPVGGRLLNGLLREVISFRHYDISEDPILINTIKESTCFLATDFNQTLKNKQKYLAEFVLPDFKTTTTGFVKTKDTPEIPSDTQILKLYDERFSIPEAYFHPEIIFDNNDITAGNSLVQNAPLKNLTDLIVESIMSCPEVTRPLLSANVCLVGGSGNIPNFTDRLISELTKELPMNWKVKIHATHDDIPLDEMSWYGGINLTNEDILSNISISKKDYFEHGANWCQKQFGFKNL
ncbi:ARP6 [[Candida] subhashii]|uniref:Actin-like protein ARP6 n=1 Tax=[Candida] subhashii TaxID=561895 RepID=A0A8J5UFK0_9ASCO|nr:ARP6 [[Candida] subhashii]KAG7662013.1 ARP6 [[Candida] subhashii]